MTGDALTRLEYLTRQAQMGLRHPLFLVGFNLVTLTLMALGLREQWNYFASWLAIMVEWMVGVYMFGQTKRDALVIREVRALARQMARDVEKIEDAVEEGPEGGEAV